MRPAILSFKIGLPSSPTCSMQNLCDPQNQVLGEYFEDDWSKIEPGCPTGRHRSALLASALRCSDAATGYLVDEGDASGKSVAKTNNFSASVLDTEISRPRKADAFFLQNDERHARRVKFGF
jgi:hypothetical protein